MKWRDARPGWDVDFGVLAGDKSMLMAINTQHVPAEWKKELRGDDTVEVMNFCVDGVWLSACQDPSDGYRSSMRGLKVVQWPRGVAGTSRFNATNVRFEHVVGDGGSKVQDILQLTDDFTGKPVLRVGTDNSDDYYPCWVASFWPENMGVNVKARAETAAKVNRVRDEQRATLGWATW